MKEATTLVERGKKARSIAFFHFFRKLEFTYHLQLEMGFLLLLLAFSRFRQIVEVFVVHCNVILQNSCSFLPLWSRTIQGSIVGTFRDVIMIDGPYLYLGSLLLRKQAQNFPFRDKIVQCSNNSWEVNSCTNYHLSLKGVNHQRATAVSCRIYA